MINLDKGSRISVSKDLGITTLRLGVGWLPQGYVMERFREKKQDDKQIASAPVQEKKGLMNKIGDFFKGDARAGDVLNAGVDSVKGVFNDVTGTPSNVREVMQRFAAVDVDTSIAFFSKGNLIDTVSFSHKNAFNGAVIHHGDNTTGEPEWGKSMEDDKEQVDIDFIKLAKNAPDVDEAIMFLNVFGGHSKHQHFGNFGGSFARLSNQSDDELAFFNLTDKYDKQEGIFLLRVYKYNDDWRVETLGLPVEYAPHWRDMIEYFKKNGLK